jgi:hypothetical protein
MTSTRTRLAAIAGLLACVSGPARGQSPFLFATQTPSIGARLMISADAGYSARAFEPVAGERLEPRAALVASLSPLFSVQGQFAAASALDRRTRFSDQLELMATPLRAGAITLGSSLGVRHEYSGADVGLARVVAARTTGGSALTADVLLERPFVAGRDAMDVVTTLGAAHAVTSRVWLGVEAVGSDLEGFWNPEEAEGGATLLVGPTLALGVADRWRLVVGGGPVIRATTDRALNRVDDGPLLGTASSRSGYVLRMSLRRLW